MLGREWCPAEVRPEVAVLRESVVQFLCAATYCRSVHGHPVAQEVFRENVLYRAHSSVFADQQLCH